MPLRAAPGEGLLPRRLQQPIEAPARLAAYAVGGLGRPGPLSRQMCKPHAVTPEPPEAVFPVGGPRHKRERSSLP